MLHDVFKPYNPHSSRYSRRLTPEQWEDLKPLLTRLQREGYSRSQMVRTVYKNHDTKITVGQLQAQMKAWNMMVYKRPPVNGLDVSHLFEEIDELLEDHLEEEETAKISGLVPDEARLPNLATRSNSSENTSTGSSGSQPHDSVEASMASPAQNSSTQTVMTSQLLQIPPSDDKYADDQTLFPLIDVHTDYSGSMPSPKYISPKVDLDDLKGISGALLQLPIYGTSIRLSLLQKIHNRADEISYAANFLSSLYFNGRAFDLHILLLRQLKRDRNFSDPVLLQTIANLGYTAENSRQRAVAREIFYKVLNLCSDALPSYYRDIIEAFINGAYWDRVIGLSREISRCVNKLLLWTQLIHPELLAESVYSGRIYERFQFTSMASKHFFFSDCVPSLLANLKELTSLYVLENWTFLTDSLENCTCKPFSSNEDWSQWRQSRICLADLLCCIFMMDWMINPSSKTTSSCKQPDCWLATQQPPMEGFALFSMMITESVQERLNCQKNIVFAPLAFHMIGSKRAQDMFTGAIDDFCEETYRQRLFTRIMNANDYAEYRTCTCSTRFVEKVVENLIECENAESETLYSALSDGLASGYKGKQTRDDLDSSTLNRKVIPTPKEHTGSEFGDVESLMTHQSVSTQSSNSSSFRRFRNFSRSIPRRIALSKLSAMTNSLSDISLDSVPSQRFSVVTGMSSNPSVMEVE